MKYLMIVVLFLISCETNIPNAIYGNLYEDDVFVTIPTANEFHQLKPITKFYSDSVDSVDSKLVIKSSGPYYVGFSLSFNTGDLASYHIAVFKNDIKQDNLSVERSGGSSFANAGANGILNLSMNDTLSIKVNSTGQQLNYSHVSFLVVKVGK